MMEAQYIKMKIKNEILDVEIIESEELKNVVLEISKYLVNGIYQVKSNVHKSVFKSFIKCFRGEKPDVHMYNINEYLKLCKEFNYNDFGSKLEIDEKSYDQNKYYKDIKTIKYEQTNIQKRDETQKLDSYLDNDEIGLFLMFLPIQTLKIIFTNAENSFTKHDRAYCLIMKQNELTEEPELFPLLDNLDGSKLSKEHLENSLNNRKKHSNYMPRVDFSYIFRLDEKIEKLEDSFKNHEDLLKKKEKIFMIFSLTIVLLLSILLSLFNTKNNNKDDKILSNLINQIEILKSQIIIIEKNTNKSFKNVDEQIQSIIKETNKNISSLHQIIQKEMETNKQKITNLASKISDQEIKTYKKSPDLEIDLQNDVNFEFQ